MKILFLDIDGVVNCKNTPQMADDFYGIDPFMALMVGRIVEATDCKIVLSSSWRHHREGVAQVEKRVMPIWDKTPSLGGIRGEEIGDWLKMHPEVEAYAILDDDSDMLPEQLPNFFQTSWEEGLTAEIAEQVINHLNKMV